MKSNVLSSSGENIILKNLEKRKKVNILTKTQKYSEPQKLSPHIQCCKVEHNQTSPYHK